MLEHTQRLPLIGGLPPFTAIMGAFDDTIGILFIGLLISAALWGVSCSQTWNYYRDFPRDTRFVQGLVAVSWTFDTVHQILCAHMMYTLLITNFARPQRLAIIVKSLPISIPMVQVSASCVQGFYAYRIWKLSHGSYVLTAPVILFNVTQIGLAIAYTVRTMKCVTFVDLNERMGGMTLAYSAFDAINDLLITVIMCWLLHTNRSTHNRTNTIINRLIFFAFTSGALTAAFAVGLVIARLILPISPAYLFFYFVIGRLYVNSLMASLNMRAQLRNNTTSSASKDSTLGPIRRPGVVDISKDTYLDSFDIPGSHELSVKVDTTHDQFTDGASTIYSGHKQGQFSPQGTQQDRV